MTMLTWVPHASLGEFVLGSSLDSAMKHERFIECKELSNTLPGLDSFHARNGTLRLEVRNGKIESVSSEVEFLYLGINLIGSTLPDVEAVLSTRADEVDDDLAVDDGPTIADFTDLGLQIVLRLGRVTSATCY